MYPHTYLNIWPAFPRNNKVFVAMSFDPAFERRWIDIIQPAIRRVEINGTRLESHRVDTRVISNSILTEILDGVSNDRLIFADISTIANANGRAVRNGNVMYELGLAHAVRQPEEVLIFRSDADALLFDLSNIRINDYDPERTEEATEQLVAAILESGRETELRKSLAVRKAASALDSTQWSRFWRLLSRQAQHPRLCERCATPCSLRKKLQR